MLASASQGAALVKLFHKGTQLTYRKGEFVIRPGESPPGVFYIETGIVKAYDITKYGEENLLIIRKKHEIFPLIWAITGQEREVIYQTLSAATLWRIEREHLLELIENMPSILAPLLDMTVEMYRIHSERIINLEYRTVRERLVSFLLTMSHRFGTQGVDGLRIEVPLKQQDIASSINASRETTSRELTALERKGLITTSDSFVTIIDKPAMTGFLR